MEISQRGFELVQAGDADGLRRLLGDDPNASEAGDATGVSLLMHSIYRGRRDLAELIASKKRALDIFEAAALGRIERLRECIREERVHGASAINAEDGAGHMAGIVRQEMNSQCGDLLRSH